MHSEMNRVNIGANIFKCSVSGMGQNKIAKTLVGLIIKQFGTLVFYLCFCLVLA